MINGNTVTAADNTEAGRAACVVMRRKGVLAASRAGLKWTEYHSKELGWTTQLHGGETTGSQQLCRGASGDGCQSQAEDESTMLHY